MESSAGQEVEIEIQRPSRLSRTKTVFQDFLGPLKLGTNPAISRAFPETCTHSYEKQAKHTAFVDEKRILTNVTSHLSSPNKHQQ